MKIARLISTIFAGLLLALTGHAQSIEGSLLADNPDFVDTTELRMDISDISLMLTAGEVDAAFEKLLAMIEEAPDDDALWYYKGVCELEMGQTDSARVSIENATRLDRANPYYYDALYEIYSALQLQRKADSLCLVMANLFPKKFQSPYIIEVAEAHRRMGNLAGYFTALQPFVEDPYIDADAKANYLSHMLQLVDASTYRVWKPQIDKIVETCAETHPSDSSALILAGQWFYAAENPDKGISYFKRWTAQNPTNFSATLLDIEISLIQGDTLAVVQICDEAFERFSAPTDQVRLLTIRGDMLYHLGKKHQAFKTYEKALKIDPNNASLLNNYAYFLAISNGSLFKAEKLSRRALELDGDNATFLDTYGWILFMRGKPADAKAYFKKAMVHGGKEHAAILLHYAIVLEALGDTQLSSYYYNLYLNKK